MKKLFPALFFSCYRKLRKSNELMKDAFINWRHEVSRYTRETHASPHTLLRTALPSPLNQFSSLYPFFFFSPVIFLLFLFHVFSLSFSLFSLTLSQPLFSLFLFPIFAFYLLFFLSLYLSFSLPFILFTICLFFLHLVFYNELNISINMHMYSFVFVILLVLIRSWILLVSSFLFISCSLFRSYAFMIIYFLGRGQKDESDRWPFRWETVHYEQED